MTIKGRLHANIPHSKELSELKHRCTESPLQYCSIDRMLFTEGQTADVNRRNGFASTTAIQR